jgi:hypothetical protein
MKPRKNKLSATRILKSLVALWKSNRPKGQGDSMMSLKKLDREMSKKAKQQQKRQRKLERRKAAEVITEAPARSETISPFAESGRRDARGNTNRTY